MAREALGMHEMMQARLSSASIVHGTTMQLQEAIIPVFLLGLFLMTFRQREEEGHE